MAFSNFNSQNNTKKRKLDSLKSSIYPSKKATSNEAENDEFYYIYDSRRKHLCSNFKKESMFILEKNDLIQSGHALKPIPGKKIRLFEMCLRFVAKNLESVESFQGFPSQVIF